jgi:hypothetical protein
MRVTAPKPSLIAALGLWIASPALAQGGLAYGQPNPGPGDDGADPSYAIGSKTPKPQAHAYERQALRYDARQGRAHGGDPRQAVDDAQRAPYGADRRAFEYERANYEALYGVGAWERRYGH